MLCRTRQWGHLSELAPRSVPACVSQGSICTSSSFLPQQNLALPEVPVPDSTCHHACPKTGACARGSLQQDPHTYQAVVPRHKLSLVVCRGSRALGSSRDSVQLQLRQACRITCFRGALKAPGNNTIVTGTGIGRAWSLRAPDPPLQA